MKSNNRILKKLFILTCLVWMQPVFADWYIDPTQCTSSSEGGLDYSQSGLYNKMSSFSSRYFVYAEVWCATSVLDDYGSELEVEIGYDDNHPGTGVICEAWSRNENGVIVESTGTGGSGDGVGVLSLQSAPRGVGVPLPKMVTLHCSIPHQDRRNPGWSGITTIRFF